MAKRTSSDGASLEKLVALLHDALKGSNTKVTQNAQVNYKSGGYGQIDVLIITKDNGFEYRTAIECKDINKNVEAAVIDAFNSKCNRMISIDKKVVVSTKGFQKGAKDAANTNGVTLCTLRNVVNVLKIDWINIKNVRKLAIESVRIVEYQAIVDGGRIIRQNNLSPEKLVTLSDGEVIPIILLIEQTIMQFHNNTVRHLVNVLDDNNMINRIDESFSIRLDCFFEASEVLAMSFIDNSCADLSIEKIEIGYVVNCIVFQPYKIKDASRYIDVFNEEVKADTLSFEIDGENIRLVKTINSDSPKLYVTNADGTVEKLNEIV